MAGFRRFELIDHHHHHFPPFISLAQTSIFPPKTFPFFLDLDHDDLNFSSSLDLLRSPSLLAPTPSPFEIFDSVTDLIQIDRSTLPFSSSSSLSSFRALVELRLGRLGSVAESVHLRSLCDRVSALEQRFDRLVNASTGRDQKYTWTAEIKSPAKKDGLERKYKLTERIKGGKNQKNYKWVTEIKGGKCRTAQKKVVEVEEEDGLVKNYRWTTEVKGKGANEDSEEEERIYSFKASSVGADESLGSKKKDKANKEEKKKKKKECKKEERDTRVVEIEDPTDHGAVVLRQVCEMSTCPFIHWSS